MPELPEVEAVARLIGREVASCRVASARAAAVSTLKSFDPPLGDLAGRPVEAISRRGKMLVIHFGQDLYAVLHLMSAGRFQLYDKPAAPKDRTTRFVVRLEDGRELRLREFGTRQSAWVRLLRAAVLDEAEPFAGLGPDAWPDPPPFKDLLDAPRPLNALLRDQRVLAGIGRSWADEILHAARLSPFKRGADLSDGQADELRTATVSILGTVVEHYMDVLRIPLPDKLPMPLTVHRKDSEPCPRCADTLQAVHFEDHDMCYCPTCQTGGRTLKDRRMSRLLK